MGWINTTNYTQTDGRTHIKSIWNTYSSSTATTASQTRLSVTLYLHCLSWYTYGLKLGWVYLIAGLLPTMPREFSEVSFGPTANYKLASIIQFLLHTFQIALKPFKSKYSRNAALLLWSQFHHDKTPNTKYKIQTRCSASFFLHLLQISSFHYLVFLNSQNSTLPPASFSRSTWGQRAWKPPRPCILSSHFSKCTESGYSPISSAPRLPHPYSSTASSTVLKMLVSLHEKWRNSLLKF